MIGVRQRIKLSVPLALWVSLKRNPELHAGLVNFCAVGTLNA